jgi:hypothetical protein
MINMTLERIFLGPRYTIGRLYVNGEYFCDTLEDVVRDLNHDGDLEDPGEMKIYGETAIGFGRYKVLVTMSPKFKRFLPLILDVKHFIGIRMHRGRYPIHTLGCILVGKNKIKGQLLESKETEEKLVHLLRAYAAVGKEIFINIV